MEKKIRRVQQFLAIVEKSAKQLAAFVLFTFHVRLVQQPTSKINSNQY